MKERILPLFGFAVALLAASQAQATVLGFEARSDNGVNDCVTTATNGCFVVTETTSPAIPNPVMQNPNAGQLLVWDEVQNHTLTQALLVDRVADPSASFVTAVSGGFEIAAGTVVSSHYAQWDPGNGSQSRVDTALVFDSDIFAFITNTQKLFDSDDPLARPGIDYNDFGLRGLESGDTTEYGSDLSRVDISWNASSPGDWTRIITAFSPAAAGSITGVKWNDLDGDGLRDSSEHGLADWEIQLFDELGDHVATTSTDSDGNYWFTDLLPGTYSVAEVLQSGWRQTFNGAPDPFSVASNQQIVADFGNQLIPTTPPPPGIPLPGTVLLLAGGLLGFKFRRSAWSAAW